MVCYSLITLISLATYLFAVNTSPLIDCPYIDSAVFLYVSRGIRNGLIPYVDMFDHKGLLIYFVQSWWLETILFTASLCYAFKWAVKYWGKASGWLYVFLHLAFFAMTCEGGDLTESWALPFITITVINLIKKINHDAALLDDFMAGISIGIILMLRPNMLAASIVYCFQILIFTLRLKQWREFLRQTFSVMLGMTTILLPLLSWLGVKGALPAFWESYIIFNLAYTVEPLIKVNSYLYYSCFILAILAAFALFLKKSIRNTFWWVFAVTFTSLAIIAIKPLYTHYFMVLIPSMAILLLLTLNQTQLRIPAIGLMALLLPWLCYRYIGGTIFHVFHLKTIKCEFVEKRKLPTSIRDILYPERLAYEQLAAFKGLIDDPNSVLVLGNECVIYHTLGVSSQSKYFYQTVARIDKNIYNAVKNDMAIGRNKFIILRRTYTGFPADMLDNAPYQFVMGTKDFKLYKRTTSLHKESQLDKPVMQL